MNILIADEVKIYSLALKSYLHKLWPDAIVYEENNLDSVIKDVFEVEYDLLIISTSIPGYEQIKHFIRQAIKYTKVIISGNCIEDEAKLKGLIELGADGFLLKTATEDEVISTLLFVFNES